MTSPNPKPKPKRTALIAGAIFVSIIIIIVFALLVWWWMGYRQGEQDLIAAGCEAEAFNQYGMVTLWDCPWD